MQPPALKSSGFAESRSVRNISSTAERDEQSKLCILVQVSRVVVVVTVKVVVVKAVTAVCKLVGQSTKCLHVGIVV